MYTLFNRGLCYFRLTETANAPASAVSVGNARSDRQYENFAELSTVLPHDGG